MSNILILVTTNPQNSTEHFFTIDYKPDFYDCYDFIYAFREYGDDLFLADWQNWNGKDFGPVWHDNQKKFISLDSLEFFDAIWIYKTREYFNKIEILRNMLNHLKALPILVINDPNTIEHNIDKSYLWDLESKGISIVPSLPVVEQNISEINENNPMILKPKFGAFGHNISLITSPEQLYELNITNHEQFILQPFIPEVKHGEISLVFLGLEYQHSFMRIPGKNSFFCNTTQGGEVIVYQPSQDAINFAKEILIAYQKLGYKTFISRLDLFKTPKGYLLSEAELFNPTLCGYYSKNLQFSKKIVRLFHRLLGS